VVLRCRSGRSIGCNRFVHIGVLLGETSTKGGCTRCDSTAGQQPRDRGGRDIPGLSAGTTTGVSRAHRATRTACVKPPDLSCPPRPGCLDCRGGWLAGRPSAPMWVHGWYAIPSTGRTAERGVGTGQGATTRVSDRHAANRGTPTRRQPTGIGAGSASRQPRDADMAAADRHRYPAWQRPHPPRPRGANRAGVAATAPATRVVPTGTGELGRTSPRGGKGMASAGAPGNSHRGNQPWLAHRHRSRRSGTGCADRGGPRRSAPVASIGARRADRGRRPIRAGLADRCRLRRLGLIGPTVAPGCGGFSWSCVGAGAALANRRLSWRWTSGRGRGALSGSVPLRCC
jgi:hypothetical protein